MLLAAVCLAPAAPTSAAGIGHAATTLQAAPRPATTLRAAAGSTTVYMTHNGAALDGVPAEARELPHLVLYRNGTLTPAQERTLTVAVTGIAVPSAGLTVTLEIETQHPDPDFRGDAGPRIPVWRASQRLSRLWYAPRSPVTAHFVHSFGATVASGTERIATPTDYFRYAITVADAGQTAADPLYVLSQEYAFLMENRWVARLPAQREEAPGAAPDELVVMYCDMFPFRKDETRASTWLPRDGITAFVGGELVPQMVEAVRVQSGEWGFPWTQAWTSYRAEDPERLSVALGEGQTWFHGPAPARGSAEISINVSGGDNAEYDTLADGIMSTFYHELFHNLQRSLNLGLGGDGRVGGSGNRWKFFSEGTAVLASSAGQPGVHLGPSSQRRAYMSYANRYLLWGGGRFRDLIANADQVDPYYSALYWRFLFESCGAMQGRAYDPGAGMRVIRRALNVLYAGAVVDIRSSTDLLGATPAVLDRALAGSSCPFQSYRESLNAFSRALYALRVEGGRCVGPGTPGSCGLYDPYNVYAEPSVRTIAYNGAALKLEIDMSEGTRTDWIDVLLSGATEGQSLALEVHGPADMDVQIVTLVDGPERAQPRVTFSTQVPAALVTERSSGGYLGYLVPEIRRATSNRLGLIIVQFEGAEPVSSPDGTGFVCVRALPQAASGLDAC